MAMIQCRECERPVSSKAKACPLCGIEKPDQAQINRENRGRAFGVVLAIVGGIFLVYMIQNFFDMLQTAGKPKHSIQAGR